ncbi:DUF4349 domain-containing protein [Paenibacillus sp. GCM10012306]|uniref:DUF4349 domain-containing protein n=1 Tax=Paenibacillus sp. GCM10012306 TaxID=3317342 RepID=UPI0036D24B01
MRKWGLYGVWLLILVIVVTGCGSADHKSNNVAADSGTANSVSKFESQTLSDTSPVAEKSSVDADSAVKAGGESGAGSTDSAEDSSAVDTGKTGAGFTGSDVVAGLNKKLIYKANLNMEVDNYAKAQTEVRNMVTLAQGYIIGFDENMSEYEQGGNFIMKVPASGFSSFLSNLEKVKHVKLQRSIQGQDVSEEYVDLESRLKAKQMMEAQYTEFMKKATKPADLVAFANELGSIQEEIERIKGRMRYIDQNVSFSTVELRLYQTDASLDVMKKKGQDPLGTRASQALSGSLNALSVTFQWIVVILAGALPILIAAAIILIIVFAFRKRRQRGHDEQSQLIRDANRQLGGKQPNAPEIRQPSPEIPQAQAKVDQTQPKVEQALPKAQQTSSTAEQAQPKVEHAQSEDPQSTQGGADPTDSRDNDNQDKK